MAPRQLAVVGGGPAGLIAAETLAVSGAEVTLYEHKRSAGRKFLLAGRGGLNLTHSEPFDTFIKRYGSDAAGLGSAIAGFNSSDLRSWCEELGEPTFVGTSGRVFPASFRATPLLRAWLRRLETLNVTLKTGHRFEGWLPDGTMTFAQPDGSTAAIAADASVLALGGASWPRVGSDGGWVRIFGNNDISVAPLQPANCGVHVAWSPVLQNKFAGSPIKNAIFRVGDQSVRGDAVVTRTGLEGGPIYGHSRELRTQLETQASAQLRIDLQPDLSESQLRDRLSKRRPKASTSTWLKSSGVPPIASALLREATGNQVPQSAGEVAHLMKDLTVEVVSLAPIERAISTAGGVRFSELDDDLMLRARPGTFVAGEMLDWEAPTGGYLLQASFSTGVLAARGALAWLDENSPN